MSSPPTPATLSVDSLQPLFQPTARVQGSLSAVAERRLLHWLAPRLPRAVTPDHLTALALLAQFAAGASFVLARTHRAALIGVVAAIAVNWFGDSLDGTLARVRQQSRPRFGFYVDHAADLLGTTALLTGLGLSGFAHPVVAASMLAGFLLLAAESFLGNHTLGRFELSHGLFGPTELRLLLIAGTLALLRSPYCHLFGHRVLLFDLGGTVGAAAMLGLFVMLLVRHTAQLFREEPVPAATQAQSPEPAQPKENRA